MRKVQLNFTSFVRCCWSLVCAKLISNFKLRIYIFSLLFFQNVSALSIFLHIVYFLVTLGNIGSLYDGWHFAKAMEVARCLLIVICTWNLPIYNCVILHNIILGYLLFSAILWLIHMFKSTDRNANKKTK